MKQNGIEILDTFGYYSGYVLYFRLVTHEFFGLHTLGIFNITKHGKIDASRANEKFFLVSV